MTSSVLNTEGNRDAIFADHDRLQRLGYPGKDGRNLANLGLRVRYPLLPSRVSKRSWRCAGPSPEGGCKRSLIRVVEKKRDLCNWYLALNQIRLGKIAAKTFDDGRKC